MTPHGLCNCGCGSPTTIAPFNDATRGWVKGQPIRYIQYHHERGGRPLRELTHDDYTVEERGYETSCWIWRGYVSQKGYGITRWRGRDAIAHRAFYEWLVAPIPDGHALHHRCEVRSCVNPEHLQPLPHGAHSYLHHTKLTPEQVREIRADPRPHRVIASDYDVSHTTIGYVKRGRVHAGV